MPGLSQLKQFNKDIQSLGDEITLRAQRGEKPVVVPIPKGITVEDDSEDFVLGMPDNPKAVDNSNVDEDLSEITGMTRNVLQWRSPHPSTSRMLSLGLAPPTLSFTACISIATIIPALFENASLFCAFIA